MLRVLFEILLPLALPTAVYLLCLRVSYWARHDGTIRWTTLPWLWLAGAGAVLLAVMLVVVTVGFGTAQKGVYVPPHLEGGHIVPGHIAPEASR